MSEKEIPGHRIDKLEAETLIGLREGKDKKAKYCRGWGNEAMGKKWKQTVEASMRKGEKGESRTRERDRHFGWSILPYVIMNPSPHRFRSKTSVINIFIPREECWTVDEIIMQQQQLLIYLEDTEKTSWRQFSLKKKCKLRFVALTSKWQVLQELATCLVENNNKESSSFLKMFLFHAAVSLLNTLEMPYLRRTTRALQLTGTSWWSPDWDCPLASQQHQHLNPCQQHLDFPNGHLSK